MCESSRPWHFDTALVKVAVAAADDDEEKCERLLQQCLTLRQLHQNVRLAEDVPVGSLIARVQLQPSSSSCQTDVRSNTFTHCKR